jgi:hypothetical protein
MIQRGVLAALALVAGLGLAGCMTGGGEYVQASAPQPSRAILDGTLRNPADWDDVPRRTARRTGKVTISSVETGPGTTAEAPAADPAVNSDEWLARERRENERLKTRMMICRNC